MPDWEGVDFLETSGPAEVEGLARILGPVPRDGRIDHHPADRLAQTVGRFARVDMLMVEICDIGGMMH